MAWPRPRANSKAKRLARGSARREPMCSNAEAPRSEAWGQTLAASRVPPDSGREGRENVAARAPEEQHDEDCARQDDLRERQIWVDVDNRRKLDPERDRVGRVRRQRPARVVDQPDHDRMFAVDQVRQGDWSEGHHGHVVDSVQEHGDMSLVRDGLAASRGHQCEIRDLERNRDVATQDESRGRIRDLHVADRDSRRPDRGPWGARHGDGGGDVRAEGRPVVGDEPQQNRVGARGEGELDRLLAHGCRQHAVDVDVHVTFGRRWPWGSGPRWREVEVGDDKDHRDGGPVPDHGVVRRRDDRERRPHGSDARPRKPEDQEEEDAGEHESRGSHAENRRFRTLDSAIPRVSLEALTDLDIKPRRRSMWRVVWRRDAHSVRRPDVFLSRSRWSPSELSNTQVLRFSVETISLKITKEQAKLLLAASREQGFPSKSEFVRYAIARALEDRLSVKTIEDIFESRRQVRAGKTVPLERLMKEE